MKTAYSQLPSKEVIDQTIKNLEKNGIVVKLVEIKAQALDAIKSIIPSGSSVMNGSSLTLEEIGFIDLLAGKDHQWRNLHQDILEEKDRQKQLWLRRQALLADYFLGSVNAITQTGEMIASDQSGSRVGAYLFSAKNLILVAGTNKITSNLNQAMKRVREYVLPLESERAKKAYGVSGSVIAKTVIIEKEVFPGRTILILINQKLGF